MWLIDPKTKEKSVTLTLLFLSFLLVIGAIICQIIGKVDSTSVSLELFYACLANYFGRKFDFKRVKTGKDESTELSQKE